MRKSRVAIETMGLYPIRKGVPLPDKKPPPFKTTGAASIYPWRRMEVGDSFLALPKHQMTSMAVRAAANEQGARLGRVFSVRTDEQGRLGVWRTK